MYRREFITERLVIKEYQKKDLDAFLRVVRQPEIYDTTYGIPRDYSRLRGKWWFRVIRRNRMMNEAYEYAVFLRDNGEYIGNVGLINLDHVHLHADISYYIASEYMNRGYATEAAREMVKYGFTELGFHKINGVCMHRNHAYRRVMEKLGMTFEGTLRDDMLKDGEFIDLDRLSILQDEYYTLCKGKN